MTLDELRDALETAETVPASALSGAVEHAAALAPDVIHLLEEVAHGVFLLPRQRNLLFYGMHVLAAARWAEALPALLAMLRQPEKQLDRVFGLDGLTESLTGFLLSLYDRNPDPLFAALEDPAVDGIYKGSFFQALSRLVWEGRVARDRFVAFLDRFDAEETAPPGDAAWEGWEDAIVYLGLAEFEDRAKRGWEAGRIAFQNDADRQDFCERLHRAAANPDQPVGFDDHVAPIDDPVEGLAYVSRWQSEDQDPTPEDASGEEDPAADIALTAQELAWLGEFLSSEKVPDSTVSLEEMDGFFAALVVGPELVMPSEYMPIIWGTEDGAGPVFDNREQLEFFHALLMRHWNTIARRVDAGYPLAPLLDEAGEEDGADWAFGFMAGIGLRAAAWQPLIRSKNFGPMIGFLAFMARDEDAPGDGLLPPEGRENLRDVYAGLPRLVRGFWEERAAGLHTEPLRSAKIGRNEPCPCGSGRKYKRCCGASGRPAA